MNQKRAYCHRCGRHIRVKKDGTLYSHGWKQNNYYNQTWHGFMLEKGGERTGVPCMGSGEKARDEEDIREYSKAKERLKGNENV